ncbi:MAG: hypothetical protein AAFQ84_10155 [Pseudomonadota bacterium]
MDLGSDYFLLLGDLKGSSSLTTDVSASVIDTVRAALRTLSDAHAADLLRPMELNYGDEFAALYRSPLRAYGAVSQIREALRGQTDFRFVVARGRLGAKADTLREMGGPVFKIASVALGSLKTSGTFGRWLIGTDLQNRTLSVLTNLVDDLIGEMTDYQYEVYRLTQEGMSGVEIAKYLDKTPQSVSKALVSSHGRTIIEAEALIRDQLAAKSIEKS